MVTQIQAEKSDAHWSKCYHLLTNIRLLNNFGLPFLFLYYNYEKNA